MKNSKDINIQVTAVIQDVPEPTREPPITPRLRPLKIYVVHSRFLRFEVIGLICVLCIVLATVMAVIKTARWKHIQTPTNVTFIPIRPPSFPLAVRTPYLSTWIPSALLEDLASSLPQFWAGQDILWGILARVDGTAYNIMGVPNPVNGTVSATVQKAAFTSTHTFFTVQAGAAVFTLDFFSPVSPSNYLRQSLPFSKSSLFSKVIFLQII